MHGYDQVKQKVAEYNERYRGPGLGPPLELSKPYYLFPTDAERATELCPSAPCPNSDMPGVYMFFDGDWRAIYVGKASCGQAIGNRLWTHIDVNNHVCTPKNPWLHEEKARYLLTVAVPRKTAFEAPMLEEFLIGELGPVRNGPGRRGKE